MVEALFTFSGRIGRAHFIRWAAFQAILSALMLAGIHGFSSGAVANLQPDGTVGAAAPNIALTLAQGIALVVCPSSALIIKRLRDVGLPPWPCFMIISLVDMLIAGFVPHSDRFAQGPFAGLAFSMVVTGLLALVPGRGAATEADGESGSADWVARAVAAEARLLEDRARPRMAADQVALLGQQIPGSNHRPDSRSGTIEPQGFGRRRVNRL